jgi:hypothetical protein
VQRGMPVEMDLRNMCRVSQCICFVIVAECTSLQFSVCLLLGISTLLQNMLCRLRAPKVLRNSLTIFSHLFHFDYFISYDIGFHYDTQHFMTQND